MAFSETLATRIRQVLRGREDLVERRMFGGLAFLIGGHMACGIVGDRLMVRLDRDEGDRLLQQPHVRPMDFTGRPMRGFLYVEPATGSTDRPGPGLNTAGLAASAGHETTGLAPERDMHPPMTARIRLIVVALAAAVIPGCDHSATGPDEPGPPPGAEVGQPFPIDRGDDGPQTPGTYKGLWLRLVARAGPVVTPVDGVIGLVCVGMSNANQECVTFLQRLKSEWAVVVNPAVRVANCAVGGHAIERWNDPAYDAVLWDDCIARKLPAAGVRPDQVRVIYHKAANQFTTGPGGSPLPSYPDPGSDFAAFRANLTTFAGRVKGKFPSVQAVYTSSRSFGGFATSASRGEPLSYEEGHALNAWLADFGQVSGVWYGWGPYLWAPDCSSGVTNRGGVCYQRTDFVTDGVHPSISGEQKISALIHARLLLETWYRR